MTPGRPLTLAGALLCALSLAGCGGGTVDEAPVTKQQTPEPAKAVQQPARPMALDLATLKKEATDEALTPSPAEMQSALRKNGIAASLASLVKKRNIKTNVSNKDQVAVRTGVLVADVVLTLKNAEKADLVRNFKQIAQGLDALGAGNDVQVTIDELVSKIQNEAVTRDDLVMNVDELSGAAIPEIEYEAGPKCVPLIQAGSWLEGANLVATAIRNSGKYEAADALLKQPDVVEYFLEFVRTDGEDRVPDEVIARLEQTLTTLLDVTRKPTLTEDDVKTIQVATDSVLAML